MEEYGSSKSLVGVRFPVGVLNINVNMKKVILGVVLLLVVGLGVYFLNKEEKYFNKVELETKNYVGLRVGESYIDTIIKVGLKELNIEGISVLVRPIPEKLLKSYQDLGMELKGAVVGSGNQYVLSIDKLSRKMTILVIAHELLHIKQYHTGDLVVQEGVFYKGINYSFELEYHKRPWELDAFEGDQRLADKIADILLK